MPNIPSVSDTLGVIGAANVLAKKSRKHKAVSVIISSGSGVAEMAAVRDAILVQIVSFLRILMLGLFRLKWRIAFA